MPLMERERRQFERYHTLAEQGDREGQYWTGYCYFFGVGVEEDEEEAWQWFLRATEHVQQSGKAKFRLADCRSSDEIGSEEWRESCDADTLVGEAIPLLTTEADSGDTESMFLLGLVNEKADLGGGAVEHGKELVMQAAELNHSVAQLHLGHAFQFGTLGLEQDFTMAFYWFDRAARGGNKTGQLLLAQLYQRGIGVSVRNWIQALYWYRQAIDNGCDGAQGQLNSLRHVISAKQRYLESCLRQSLQKVAAAQSAAITARSKTFFVLGMWGFALETLAAQHHQPAGFSPTFVAVRELVPQIFDSTASHRNRKEEETTSQRGLKRCRNNDKHATLRQMKLVHYDV